MLCGYKDGATAPLTRMQDEPRKADLAARFSPYISPLRFFKSYRYHPKFTDDVSGGYRSLSYSHNIDLVKPVCPYEAAGGVCNDNTCEFQHWRDMVLSGALMGSRIYGTI
jgi:hypothetical protein